MFQICNPFPSVRFQVERHSTPGAIMVGAAIRGKTSTGASIFRRNGFLTDQLPLARFAGRKTKQMCDLRGG